MLLTYMVYLVVLALIVHNWNKHHKDLFKQPTKTSKKYCNCNENQNLSMVWRKCNKMNCRKLNCSVLNKISITFILPNSV